jgi:hypothetical protein
MDFNGGVEDAAVIGSKEGNFFICFENTLSSIVLMKWKFALMIWMSSYHDELQLLNSRILVQFNQLYSMCQNKIIFLTFRLL